MFLQKRCGLGHKSGWVTWYQEQNLHALYLLPGGPATARCLVMLGSEQVCGCPQEGSVTHAPGSKFIPTLGLSYLCPQPLTSFLLLSSHPPPHTTVHRDHGWSALKNRQEGSSPLQHQQPHWDSELGMENLPEGGDRSSGWLANLPLLYSTLTPR